MKRFVWFFLAVALIVGLVSGVGLATLPADHETFIGRPTTVFVYGDGDSGNAKVFRVGEGHETECNESPRVVEVDVRAKVAQWAKFVMEFNGWHWYVKKPGDYYADSITAELQSNGPVRLLFSGFGNLRNENSVNQEIATFFAFSEVDPECEIIPIPTDSESDWMAASKLNDFTWDICDSQALHDGYVVKLWNRITVVECNSPGLYEMGEATVTLTLTNQEHWVEHWGDSSKWEAVYTAPAPKG